MKKYSNLRPLALCMIILIMLPFLASCQALKYKPVDAREVSPDPKDRVRKNIEEGRGFRIMGGKKGGTFDFASSNPLWRAALDTIDFMPLVSANYSGGIVITDWYSESGNEDESIKISIRFVSNEIRTDALNIKVFIKNCDQNKNCVINESQGNLRSELRSNILKRAAKYQKEGIDLNKKKNPYNNAQLDDKDGN
tara:strand:- start:6605 stop:7189 length:585 start_codon:yes stop_codon:yes gene_type:complete